MNTIISKKVLAPNIVELEVRSPRLSNIWKPGQFVIVRPRSDSERIPLTLVKGDPQKGTITLVIQGIGKTTLEIVAMEPLDKFSDLVGPLGEPASVKYTKTALCVAGGVGVAEVLPVARAYHEVGNFVTVIVGARTRSLILFEDELRLAMDEVIPVTDDGTYGIHGTVVDAMKIWQKDSGKFPGIAHVIGPIPMMRSASALTKEWSVKTYASVNPIMIDGTGMCGGCRVTVGGKMRFACVEGPEFDAHEIDWDELARRNKAYRGQEQLALGRCKNNNH